MGMCAERDLPGHGRDYPVVKNIEEQSGKGVSGEVLLIKYPNRYLEESTLINGGSK